MNRKLIIIVSLVFVVFSITAVSANTLESVDGDNSVVSSNEMTVVLNDENNQIDGVLTDGSGNLMSNEKISYNGKSISTDENGAFLLQKNSDDSDSHISISQNDMLKVPEIETKIISSSFTSHAIDFSSGERGNYFKFRLVDGSGNPLANKNVQVGFSGVVYDKVTDSNGYGSLQINLNTPFVYTFAMAYLGDNTYKAAFDVQQITIIKKTCSISASAKSFKAKSKNKLYTITLKSDKCSSIDGKPYMGSGKQVTLKVNKKSYVAKTNKKGQATFSININKKGTYTAKITYAGNVMYSGAQKNVKIKII